MIDNILRWVGAFPGFSGMELYLDTLPWKGNSVGLFPRGLTQISRREDILGNITERRGFSVTAAVCLSKAAGESAPENAELLHSFALWAQEAPPVLGENQVFLARKGQLKAADRLGLGRYEIELSWEYDTAL